FPTALSGSVNHTVETAYGHITRPADGHEQPGHRWIILHPAETGSGNAGTPPASKTPAPSPQNGADNLPKSKSANTLSAHSASPTPALLLLNDAKYAYSTPGADLRLTITRSPPHALHRRPKPGETFDHMMDQGRQTFRFKLIPQNTPDTAAATRSAEEFCAPKFALLQGIHPGKLPPKGSLLSLDAPNLVIGALKQSEDAPGRLVIRLHETAGQPADATLTILGNPHRIRLRPHELKTLLHDPAANTLRETNLLEE
ncbi:MAG: glycosyl hydrolase-related protein, partial [Opitutaceae bacterium]|nr:glycosyl hydrolase-related protein [Opitutaceae bacterium]